MTLSELRRQRHRRRRCPHLHCRHLTTQYHGNNYVMAYNIIIPMIIPCQIVAVIGDKDVGIVPIKICTYLPLVLTPNLNNYTR